MNPLLDNFFNRQILVQYGPSVLAGFWVTVEVALLTIVVGVGLGVPWTFIVGRESKVGIGPTFHVDKTPGFFVKLANGTP